MASLESLLRWLNSHINLEAGQKTAGQRGRGGEPMAGATDGLSLSGMRSLLTMLGEPQLDLAAVQLTGTNGKGSTAAILASILHAHGVRVGTYASPHVERINERIRLDTEPVSDEILAEALADVKLAADHVTEQGTTLSWFELMTAAAYRIFNDHAVQVAIIEVGMLGRFDATNVIDAEVAIVTNLSRDHTDGQPGWREKVAHEKAGIISPGSTLILGPVGPDVAPIFRNEGASRILEAETDFSVLRNGLAVGGRVVDIRTSRGQYEDLFVALNGEVQAANTALAMVAAEEMLGTTLDPDLLGQGLAAVQMPGRFEVVGREPLVVLDGAHNPAGAAVAAETLRSDFNFFGDTYMLLGWMKGKDPSEMLEAFDARNAELVVITEPSWPRVMPATEIAAAARAMGVAHEIVSSPLDGLDRLRTLAAENDAILVAGSFYLVGPVRTALRSDRDDEHGDEDGAH